jgi:hypothetical protein
MCPDNLRGRCVDQIPVVNRPGIFQVEAMNQMPRSIIAPRMLTNENQQREQPLFVPRGREKCQDILHGQIVILPRQGSERWDRDTEKAIALPVLAGPRLEKPLIAFGALG